MECIFFTRKPEWTLSPSRSFSLAKSEETETQVSLKRQCEWQSHESLAKHKFLGPCCFCSSCVGPEIQHAKQDAKETILGLNHQSLASENQCLCDQNKLGLQLTLFFIFFIHFAYLLRSIPCDGMLCSALMQAEGLGPASTYSLFVSDFNMASSLGVLMVFRLCNKVRDTLWTSTPWQTASNFVFWFIQIDLQHLLGKSPLDTSKVHQSDSTIFQKTPAPGAKATCPQETVPSLRELLDSYLDAQEIMSRQERCLLHEQRA